MQRARIFPCWDADQPEGLPTFEADWETVRCALISDIRAWQLRTTERPIARHRQRYERARRALREEPE